MTTSGIVQTQNPIADLIDIAFTYCQIAIEEEGLSPEEYATALKVSNQILRNWQAQGIHLWQYQNATLFPQAGRTLYNLKPEDDTAGPNTIYSKPVRCIRSDVVLYGFMSNTAPPVPYDDDHFILLPTTYDCDGKAWAAFDGDSMVGARIGSRQLGDDYIEWYEITEWEWWPGPPPDQAVEKPSDGQIWNYWRIRTTDYMDTEDGQQVILYQDGYQVNVERVLDVRRVNNAGTNNENETPIKLDSHQEFQRLPTKRSRGVPNIATFDRLVNGGCLNLWQAPQNEFDFFIRLTFERTFENFATTGDTADFPNYWEDAFCWNLADRLAVIYRSPPDVKADIQFKAQETLNQALDYDNANYDIKVVINNRGGV